MKPFFPHCSPVRLSACLSLAWFVSHSAAVLALPDDRFKDLSISADSAELDDQNGTTTYAGSVIVEQGSMQIRAERVVIYGRKDTYSRVVAIGKPARLSQVPKAGQEPVTARAGRMEYQITSETLILLDNAAFSQEGTSLSGNRIEYDVKRAVVKAGGKSDAQGDDKRVRMVIPPKALSKEETEADATETNNQRQP